jgi:photosystem II stability/assembly factor-like uncharacterized protein
MEPGSGGWLTGIRVSPHDGRRVLLGGDMLGIAVSTDRGDSWQAAFGLDSWEIADFTWHPSDPDRVWAGTMSGPYLSEDGGVNWVSKRAGFPAWSDGSYSAPVQKVLFDPSDPSRLLAFGGSHRRWSSPGTPLWGRVWESADGGESWRRLADLGANVLAAQFGGRSADTLYAAVDGRGIFVSVDGGTAWEARNNGLPFLNVNWVEAHAGDAAVAWAALGNSKPAGQSAYAPGGIYKTSDAGLHWAPANAGLGQSAGADGNQTARYETVAASASNPDLLYTSNTAYNGAAVYKSTDGGASWKIAASNVKRAYPAGLGQTVAAVDPSDADAVFTAGSEYVLRSLDGGRTWSDATAVQPAGSADWRGRGFSGLVCTNFRFHPSDPGRSALVAMDHGNFWQSADGFATWRWGGNGLPSWGGGTDASFSGQATAFAALGQGYFEGIGRTTDGGRNWTVLSGSAAGLPERYAGVSPSSVYVLPDDSNRVWAAVGGRLYASSNLGRRWAVVHEGPGLSCIAAEPGRPTVFYVCGDRGVYRTSDGQAFDLLPGGPAPATYCAADPNRPGTVYACSWRNAAGGVWRFDGSSWRRLRTDAYIAAVAVHPANPDILAAATNDHPYHDRSFATGVWISEDGGGTWERRNDGLPCLRGQVIVFEPRPPHRLVFGTGGRGFWITDTASGTDGGGPRPSGLGLSLAYPNPFNGGTRIRVFLPGASAIRARVFDLEGRVVRDLSVPPAAAGSHTLAWDGRDDGGRVAPSGVYVLRVEASGSIRCRKMTFVR